MNVFELYGSLGLKTDDFSKGLKTSKGLFNSFGNELSASIDGVANILSGVVDTVGVLDNAVTSAFDAAVSTVTGGLEKMASVGVSFAESFMQTGLSFDSSISQVSATLLKTQDEFNETKVTIDGFSGSLRDLALEMGSSTKFTATQAGEALNYMALAGYDAQTSAEMLPKVLNLASAGAMDLGAASDMVTDAQTALGLSIDDTSVLIDQMAKTASSSNTSVSQLGDAILSIGATGRQLKGGYVELNTVLGVLADNGIKASEGGNDLRRMLVRLSSPSKEGATALEKLGVSAYDAQGKIKAMPDLFLELNNAMSGLTEEGKNNAVSDIFGQYALAGANALLNTSAERWKELKEKIVDSEGAAKEMADIQLDNLQGKLTIMKSALEGLQISFSDLFSGKAQEYVETFSNGLADITTQIREGDFKGGFYALGNTIVDLIDQGADDILNSEDEATSFVDGLIVFANKVVGKLIERGAELLPSIMDFLTDTGTKAINAICDIVNDPEKIGKIIGTINLVLTKIQTFLDENEDELYTIFDKIFDSGIGIVEKIFVLKRKTIGDILIRKIKEVWGDVTEEGKRLFEEAKDDYWAFWQPIGDSLWEFISTLPENWESNFQPLGDAIWNSIDLMRKRVKKWWNTNVVDEISRLKKWWQTNIVEYWSKKILSIADWFNDAKNDIEYVFEDFSLESIGENLIEGLWSGISNAKDWLIEKIGGFTDGVTDAFKDFFGIESPSKLFRDEVGTYLAQGIGVGFSDEMNSVVKDMERAIPTSFDMGVAVSDNKLMNQNDRQNYPTIVFNIQNVNGVSERDAHSFALNVADELSDIIFRDKVVRA